jgi:hypothetical protein
MVDLAILEGERVRSMELSRKEARKPMGIETRTAARKVKRA